MLENDLCVDPSSRGGRFDRFADDLVVTLWPRNTYSKHIGSSRVFAELERNRPVPASNDDNPYTETLALQNTSVTTDTVSAEVTASPGQCAGHFPSYPALPVAYLLTAEFELGAELARNRLGDQRVIPVTGQLVDANTLIPADRPVALRGRAGRDSGQQCAVDMTAADDGNVAITTRSTYRVLPFAGRS